MRQVELESRELLHSIGDGCADVLTSTSRRRLGKSLSSALLGVDDHF